MTKVKKQLTRKQKITNIVVFSSLLVIIGVVLFMARNNTDNAKVGDCMKDAGSTSFEQVKCDDPAAKYKVVGRVDKKVEQSEAAKVCEPFQAQGATKAYWRSGGNSSFVLCMSELGK